MSKTKRSGAVTAALLLVSGCSAPAAAPAAPEAVDRAVSEAELQLKAVQGQSEPDSNQMVEDSVEGVTT